MDQFDIDTSVLQGDCLAPITDSDGFTLKRCQSLWHPAEILADLADDIALIENTVESAQDLLLRVEKACQEVGLYSHGKPLS